MQLYLGLAAVAVTIATVLIGGTSLASAQDPPPPCEQGQLPPQSGESRPNCTPQPNTTVSARAGTVRSFTASVPTEQCSASGSWCHVEKNLRWSSCRGPFTLEWDPAEGEGGVHMSLNEAGDEIESFHHSDGVVGVEARGTRLTVDVGESRTAPLYLTYVYVGQRSIQFSGTPDGSGNRPISTYTANCSISGVARINVTPRSSTIYGHTVPADADRSGGNVWVVVTPAEGGVGYTDPQHPDNQVGKGNGTLVRVGDLPTCPTLPPGERPDHQCRTRG